MSDDNGLDVVDDVTITREKYEWFVRMTTPQPIETAPKRGKNILLSNGLCLLINHQP